MPVKIFLTSGETRVVTEADDARLEDQFFLITMLTRQGRQTVLTLWAKQVIAAEVEKDGVVVMTVLGLGERSESRPASSPPHQLTVTKTSPPGSQWIGVGLARFYAGQEDATSRHAVASSSVEAIVNVIE